MSLSKEQKEIRDFYKKHLELSDNDFLTPDINRDKVNFNYLISMKKTLLTVKEESIKIINILNSSGIIYWGDGGGILGPVRHKGLIPWDKDIDIGMEVNQKQNLFDLFYKREDYFFMVGTSRINDFNKKLFFNKNTHPVLLREKTKNIILLDIFFYTRVKGVPNCYRNQDKELIGDIFLKIENWDFNKENGVCNYSLKNHYPLIKQKYYDTYIPIPSNYKIYLDTYYGKNWETMGWCGAGGLYLKARRILDFSPI